MLDTLQELFATLRRSKLRTTLTGISVSTGIFLLILLLGAGNGIIHAFENVSGSMALDVIQMFGGVTSKPYQGLKEGRWISLDQRDMNIVSTNFHNEVNAAVGMINQEGVVLQNGTRYVSRKVSGVNPEYVEMSNQIRNMAAGRFINHIDMQQRRKVIVISQKDARLLFGNWRSAVGKYVNAQNVSYQIAGVYPDMSMNSNEDVYMPVNTLKTIYHKDNNVDIITLKTEGITTEKDVDKFAAKYRSIGGPVHQYAPDDEDAVWMWSTTTGAEQSAQAMSILRAALWIIGLLTLISGVVGISNIMLITVKERTHEFGIRKALGARPGAILRGVIIESVVITTIFGYIGMLLGIFATEYLNVVGGESKVQLDNMTMTVFSNPTVDLTTCFEALAVMIVAGVVAGLIPARKAVKVKPIEALRAE